MRRRRPAVSSGVAGAMTAGTHGPDQGIVLESAATSDGSALPGDARGATWLRRSAVHDRVRLRPHRGPLPEPGGHPLRMRP